MACRRASTCWSSRGHKRPRHGPMSRWPKAATGGAGSARSRRSAESSARGRRLRSLPKIEALKVREIVLVAQDLASYGRDRTSAVGKPDRAGPGIVELIGAVSQRVDRVRLLYLYPSSLSDRLVEAIVGTGVPYFDLSLQHASGSLLRKMRRWGDATRFLERIGRIRRLEPGAVFRSSFILGYPGETEEDHDELLRFIEEANLDWAGFFTFSREAGTLAAGLGRAGPELARTRAPPGVLGAPGGDHGPSAPAAGGDDERSTGRPARPCPVLSGSTGDRRHRAGATFCPGRLAGRGPLHRRGRARS